MPLPDRGGLVVAVAAHRDEGEEPEAEVAADGDHDPVRVVHRVQVPVVEHSLQRLDGRGEAEREQKHEAGDAPDHVKPPPPKCVLQGLKIKPDLIFFSILKDKLYFIQLSMPSCPTCKM